VVPSRQSSNVNDNPFVSYRPAILQRLAESIPWLIERFKIPSLGSLTFTNSGSELLRYSQVRSSLIHTFVYEQMKAAGMQGLLCMCDSGASFLSVLPSPIAI
jgi:hypothetical protein